MSKLSAERYVAVLLERIRARVAAAHVDRARLPGWIHAARVRIGHHSDTALILFEDSPDGDEVSDVGHVRSDLSLIFDMFSDTPARFVLRAHKTGNIVILGDASGQSI